jgi:hypothetical protein
MAKFQTLAGNGWKVTSLGLQPFPNPPFTARTPVFSFSCRIDYPNGTSDMIHEWWNCQTEENAIALAVNHARAKTGKG